MIYLGIDNGISGSLVALGPESHIIASLIMPTQKARKGNEVDVRAVWSWIDHLCKRENIIATIEEPGGSKSAQAASSMAGSFHALRAMFELKSIRWSPTTPQAWQKVMLPGCKAGDTKPRALSTARRLWPDETWLASDRCRVPHDGLIDAALIAEWSRTRLSKA